MADGIGLTDEEIQQFLAPQQDANVMSEDEIQAFLQPAPEPVAQDRNTLSDGEIAQFLEPQEQAPSPVADILPPPDMGDKLEQLSILPEHIRGESLFGVEETPADRLAKFDEAVGDTPEDVKARQDDIAKIERRREAIGPLGALSKGVLGGITLGISTPILNEVEDAFGIERIGGRDNMEKAFNLSGTVIGTIMTGKVISDKLASLTAPIKSKLAKLLAIRLGTSGTVSGGNSLVQIATGQRDLPDATKDIGVSMAGTAIAMIPELAIPSGGAVGTVANFAGQVITDLAFDMAVDPDFKASVEEHGTMEGFKEWMSTPEQLVRTATSIALAGRDAADADFETTRVEILNNTKANIANEWRRAVEGSFEADPRTRQPLVSQPDQKVAFGKTRPRETEFGRLLAKSNEQTLRSPTESQIRDVLAGTEAGGGKVSVVDEALA